MDCKTCPQQPKQDKSSQTFLRTLGKCQMETFGNSSNLEKVFDIRGTQAGEKVNCENMQCSITKHNITVFLNGKCLKYFHEERKCREEKGITRLYKLECKENIIRTKNFLINVGKIFM